jgi:hypothetical protein
MFTYCSAKPLVAPFAFRFWDPVTDTQVRDDLNVTATPPTPYAQAVQAVRTPSGNYAFHGLPGLHDIEYPKDDHSPRTRRKISLIIRVEDGQRRYLPFAFSFEEEVPLAPGELWNNEIFHGPALASPPGAGLPVIHLFSAPTRPVPPGMAAIRGSLTDHARRKGASHAVLRVSVKGKDWVGMANDRGDAVVCLPFPTPEPAFSSSSPPRPAPLQEWKLSVGIGYSPDSLNYLPAAPPGAESAGAAGWPDLGSILKQQPALIWRDEPPSAGAVFEFTGHLAYGQELVLRTGSGSALLIDAAATSP